mmetsp:Transcript_62155/g.122909  ORF Transcript_62155/g.122909 Transcript_62155/m.122909 type:complete len:366 (-) Transcript_62155:55-1152(-)
MEGKQWRAGIHPFMDWTQEERKALNGYKPASARTKPHRVSLLHESARGMRSRTFGEARANLTAPSVAGGLPVEIGPRLRNQGSCGSCWAISAVEAVEAQLQKSGIPSPQISAQALVDCVPNPQHCGGTGGCDGATGELAYALMRDHGIPLEDDLPYTAQTGSCPQSLGGTWQAAKRVRVDGWKQLPSNQVEPLLHALVNDGPVVVAVDGNSWFDYSSGVFDSCSKDAILGHAVLAKGYGTESGNRYWLIQNSWGSGWGEQGHIRLLMHQDEEQWCGIDKKPKEGVGCDGGPSEITVCGTCGILYDPIIPTGVRLEGESNPDARGSQAVASDTTPQKDVIAPQAVVADPTSEEKQMDDIFKKYQSQ